MISYSSFKTTLKETSKDTSSESQIGEPTYMTNSLKQVVDFDLFQEEYFKENYEKAKKPGSVDALCMLENKWCLIEFKNGKIKYSDLTNKIGNSVAIVTFKDNISTKEFKNNSIFILVYNKNSLNFSDEEYQHFNELAYLKPKQINKSSSFDFIVNQVSKNSCYIVVNFGLKTFENVYFSKVMTMDKEVFNQFIRDKTMTIPQD